MSTYTTIHNRVRENISIDAKKRMTDQQVKMLNEQNEFHGTFCGKFEPTEYEISGGTIIDSTLSNVAITTNGSIKNAYSALSSMFYEDDEITKITDPSKIDLCKVVIALSALYEASLI